MYRLDSLLAVAARSLYRFANDLLRFNCEIVKVQIVEN
jgi:hypothetical protein